MPRRAALLLASVLALPLAGALLARSPAPAAARLRGGLAAPARAAPVALEAPAPGRAGHPPAPAAATAARTLDEALEALESGEPAAPGDEALLAAALSDPDAPPPLRAGALRALLRLRGRELLPALPDLFARADAAPLRPLLAGVLARAAGPDDAALLRDLEQAGERTGEDPARLLALRAAVAAARRDPDDQPTRLEARDEARLAAGLGRLCQAGQPGATRRAALEGLAELGGAEGRAALLAQARGAPDEEDRLDAALLLRELDPAGAEALLDALGTELCDPLLRDRLATARGD